MLVAMSTGGVYNSRDGGQTWNPGNTGIHAYFMPHNEWPEFGQCVHKVPGTLPRLDACTRRTTGVSTARTTTG